MPERQRTLTDPRALRALAHPVRIAIIEQLTVHGALTASQVSERIEESPANCSWHLRKLAEHGFVEEAHGGTGRQRPWQVSHLGVSWNDFDGPAELAVAGEALSQVLVAREVDRLYDARRRLRDDAADWQQSADVTQSAAWLTAAELRELNDAVRTLLMEKTDRFEDASKRPAGSRLCALVSWGVPTYGIADPTHERSESRRAEPGAD
ncbi:helix-turn-helix domain-containing protein [Nocardioides terrisoli]|uniref:helix-turn-helix domain-containing protein n=1 Tax=Nocardioides terrisoli TaxID=3388267 RepID=UPI00287BA512|nr:helix-turn-helix domain-containing protein [Nocardioides marmorisolisilvae]